MGATKKELVKQRRGVLSEEASLERSQPIATAEDGWMEAVGYLLTCSRQGGH